MPPKGQHKDSASESESKAALTSRAANKARNAVAAAAQLELLSKYVHSNGPKDKRPVEPSSFSDLDENSLHKYKKKYNLDISDTQTLKENILNSELGKKTHSYKRSRSTHKISKVELANNLHKHFLSTSVRENEIITSFLYRIKNEDKEFKLNF